jgi:hypothetical protein
MSRVGRSSVLWGSRGFIGVSYGCVAVLVIKRQSSFSKVLRREGDLAVWARHVRGLDS